MVGRPFLGGGRNPEKGKGSPKNGPERGLAKILLKGFLKPGGCVIGSEKTPERIIFKFRASNFTKVSNLGEEWV